MLDHEVVVAGLLELGVEGLVGLVAGVLLCLVEVLDVLLKDVGGGQVRAAAKPPCAGRAGVVLGRLRLKVAVVEVHGGRHGVVRVHHAADARREEGDVRVRLLRISATCCGAIRLWGHLAVHHRYVDARLLEHLATLQDAADAPTPPRAGPRILAELAPVQLLDGRADLVLRRADHLLKLRAHAVAGGAVGAEQSGGRLRLHLLRFDGGL
mmetsp:Transcript_2958/g.4980  ORF Transcript_2958/g.4980 Transcript_2958/m.4980 type:complete len:210 (+) Transcript_2958:858-1487(+)